MGCWLDGVGGVDCVVPIWIALSAGVIVFNSESTPPSSPPSSPPERSTDGQTRPLPIHHHLNLSLPIPHPRRADPRRRWWWGST